MAVAKPLPLIRCTFSHCAFVVLLGLFLGSSPAKACNVPVFRYALEKWKPGKYDVFVFHKGSLNSEQQAAVKLLQDEVAADPARGNINLEVVDLNQEPAKELVALHQSLKSKDLPVMTVLYPVITKIN